MLLVHLEMEHLQMLLPIVAQCYHSLFSIHIVIRIRMAMVRLITWILIRMATAVQMLLNLEQLRIKPQLLFLLLMERMVLLMRLKLPLIWELIKAPILIRAQQTMP